MFKAGNNFHTTAGELFLFFSGIIIFTYFSQQKGLLFIFSFPGLILSAIIVVLHNKSWPDLKKAFGLNWVRKENVYFMPLSVLLAVFFSLLYRYFLKLDIFPTQFISFAILAAMIGAAEELIFRGYIQFRSRELGVIVSIFAAAITHTVYKYILFSSLPDIAAVNMGFLVFWTIVVGLILGILKEISGTCWVPIIFHVVFDILVYGDGAIDTWWVFAYLNLI